MNLNTEHDNWKEIAPKLAKMDKLNPFTVPDGYFESLADRIQSRVAENQSAKIKIFPLWIRYAAAACLTLGISLALYLNLNKNAMSFEEIPDQEIVSYLEVNMDDTETEMLFEKLNDDQISILTENFDEQEVETYLKQLL